MSEHEKDSKKASPSPSEQDEEALKALLINEEGDLTEEVRDVSDTLPSACRLWPKISLTLSAVARGSAEAHLCTLLVIL